MKIFENIGTIYAFAVLSADGPFCAKYKYWKDAIPKGIRFYKAEQKWGGKMMIKWKYVSEVIKKNG